MFFMRPVSFKVEQGKPHRISALIGRPTGIRIQDLYLENITVHIVTRTGFQRTNQTPNEGSKPHKVNGLYGRPGGTRTLGLYRVK